MPTGRATIAVGNEEEPHPPPARSSGARPKERRRGAGPPSWRASTPPEKLQNLAQEDRGSAAPVVIFGDAALSCNADLPTWLGRQKIRSRAQDGPGPDRCTCWFSSPDLVGSVAPLSATETGIKRPVGPRKLPLLSGKGPWEQWREPAGHVAALPTWRGTGAADRIRCQRMGPEEMTRVRHAVQLQLSVEGRPRMVCN
ncbi:unnamed protein product [Prorocentrum cordatum]|uniref:Uncharacterized protein n=1 Tax=Prorocentrum cordatum TaxID=2364126 RepID=A0ABN9TB79_9DINO|nr:unnamed protein product [Polarella glacialis]